MFWQCNKEVYETIVYFIILPRFIVNFIMNVYKVIIVLKVKLAVHYSTCAFKVLTGSRIFLRKIQDISKIFIFQLK